MAFCKGCERSVPGELVLAEEAGEFTEEMWRCQRCFDGYCQAYLESTWGNKSAGEREYLGAGA